MFGNVSTVSTLSDDKYVNDEQTYRDNEEYEIEDQSPKDDDEYEIEDRTLDQFDDDYDIIPTDYISSKK